jgi:hypothetical protein
MLTLLDSIDVHKLIGVRDLRLHRAHGLYSEFSVRLHEFRQA